ncbi:hypothetical protein HY032_02220 [Candidatus Gottesmanbacteria bacterium]|nr:hypothetical protein [Candidatus Gottesmanbacteria bacterium]
MSFNPSPPTIMHIDLNSCFASVEQQANPRLRGKPIAVAAYTTGNGCILAPSVEAKRFGVKTGMRVRDGKALCPDLIVLSSDPWKYRYVNRKLLALLREYSSDVAVQSIDEMVMDMAGMPSLEGKLGTLTGLNLVKKQGSTLFNAMLSIAYEIKRRIKEEIGDWLTVSIGIAPNRFLAKTAACLHKPNGLDIITKENIEEILTGLRLEDLCDIKHGNSGRLRLFGITTTRAFYRATAKELETAFHSIVGHHWWMRLHGWEIDDRQFDRKSFGHSYALYKPYTPLEKPVQQILSQLVTKMGRRLRTNGYQALGIHVSILYVDSSFWHHGQKVVSPLFSDSDLYEASYRVLEKASIKPVRILSVSCFHLSRDLYQQQTLFVQEQRKERLTQAIDAIADRWGDFAVTSGRMLSMEARVLDRIAFGGVAELEEFVFQERFQERVAKDYLIV